MSDREMIDYHLENLREGYNDQRISGAVVYIECIRDPKVVVDPILRKELASYCD
jgi:hypothetical protein